MANQGELNGGRTIVLGYLAIAKPSGAPPVLLVKFPCPWGCKGRKKTTHIHGWPDIDLDPTVLEPRVSHCPTRLDSYFIKLDPVNRMLDLDVIRRFREAMAAWDSRQRDQSFRRSISPIARPA